MAIEGNLVARTKFLGPFVFREFLFFLARCGEFLLPRSSAGPNGRDGRGSAGIIERLCG